jgi:pimeloyl-ACP methyl ester carboxylesterase
MAFGVERRLHLIERGTVRAAALVFFVLLTIAVAGFVIWASNPLGPLPEAIDALESGPDVSVTTLATGWLFEPTGDTPSTGLVLYPGGRVDPRSYAPLARAIAAEGHVVTLASMPLNLAVLDADRADTLIAAAQNVERWAVGGHSLGGAMAAAYASEADVHVRGLVLLAAYPPSSTDLSSSDLAVLSVLGDADEVVDREVWDEGLERLPAVTRTVMIAGGNHAWFGHYGEQPGDGAATISREEQQRLTVDAVVELLGRM